MSYEDMKSFKDMLDIFKSEEEEARKLAPKVIAVQRKKLLIALKETPDEEISEDDLQLVHKYKKRNKYSFRFPFEQTSIPWDDTKAREKVDAILKKHVHFDLSKYLDYSKLIFLAYSGELSENISPGRAMEYILTHARQFGDPSKKIFKNDDIKNENNLEGNVNSARVPPNLPQLPKSKVFIKLRQLLDDLKSTYDEQKFQILNANVTYFTLLMLRRVVKNQQQFMSAFKKIDTHDNYVKLCPYPLDNMMPKCGFKTIESWLVDAACLAIEAYLNNSDDKTTRALRTTCIVYLEWNGLQLPHLFFKVTNLYRIKAAVLFDLLLSVKLHHENILHSLIELSDDYYAMYEKSKLGGTNKWYPFCRVCNSAYHFNLSAKENTMICIVLAYLVDMKLGFDKSTIREAHWVKPQFRIGCMKIAEVLYEKINVDV